MKRSLLLPHRYHRLGWVLFLVFGSLYVYCNMIYPSFHEDHALEIPGFEWSLPATNLYTLGNSNLTPVLLSSGVLVGLLLICFTKSKEEDEYIASIRLQSWQWAVLVSYAILFVANWLLYGYGFFIFMIYNLITIPLVFIIRFQYCLYSLKKERTEYEK